MKIAILTIGYGKNRLYTLREVLSKTATNPITGKKWQTEAGARREADMLGLIIIGCGDRYDIIKYAD